MEVPYHYTTRVDNQDRYVLDSLQGRSISGDGVYNKKCQEWFKAKYQADFATLTPSCTSSLEMGVVIADIQPGDEIIMPSFTFTSTATAAVLFGAKPIFIDIRRDTLNIDETLIEQAITAKTKAIFPVHYAGVSCEMSEIRKTADRHGLIVIEDAAQAIGSVYQGQPVGRFGHMSCFSFHDTKNVTCGEGGAFLINERKFLQRAEIIRDKGTNRARFVRGEIDKYSWVEKGSSYLASEMQAALLMAQLEHIEQITQKRLETWRTYEEGLTPLIRQGLIRILAVPQNCKGNGHLFCIFLESFEQREKMRHFLISKKIQALTHYVPLHSSEAGKKYGKAASDMKQTDAGSATLLRLPMFTDISKSQVAYVISMVIEFFKK